MMVDTSCATPLSDGEATALADGASEWLAPAVLLHAEQCELCAARVADQALLSGRVGSTLLTLARETAPLAENRSDEAPPVASPTKPILIALVIAILASLPLAPSLGNSGLTLLAAGRLHAQAAWQVVTAVVTSLNSPIWTFSAAIGLVVLSSIFLRFAQRSSITEQGVSK